MNIDFGIHPLSAFCLIGLVCGLAEAASPMETHYGDKQSKDKLLIVYATRAGSTAEVADFVGKAMAKNGFDVDITPANEVKDLSKYTAVILASGVRAGKVYPEILRFAKQNHARLKQIPTACIILCMVLQDPTLENKKAAESYAAPLKQEISPVDIGLFAGKMDYAKLGFVSRMIIKHMVKTPEGDFRDWKAIEAWAESLKQKLKATGG